MTSINKEKCIGCSSCEAVAPEIFEMQDGKAQVKKQPATEKENAKTKEAADICPVDAITP